MSAADVDTLKAVMTELLGLELKAEDLDRTAAMAAPTIKALQPYTGASLFDGDANQFAAVLDELADSWEPGT